MEQLLNVRSANEGHSTMGGRSRQIGEAQRGLPFRTLFGDRTGRPNESLLLLGDWVMPLQGDGMPAGSIVTAQDGPTAGIIVVAGGAELDGGMRHPFFQDPELQGVAPPPPMYTVSAAGHLYTGACQLLVLVRQLAVCQRVHRWAHRCPHRESLTSSHHKPPHLRNSSDIILCIRGGVNGIAVLCAAPPARAQP